MTAAAQDQALQAARRATAVAFIGSGFAFATWASRIPQVRDARALDPSELGLVLLAIAAGSVVALPLAGPAVARLGSRAAVVMTALLLAVAFGVVAVGYAVGVAPLVVGLFLFGFANGAWDVGMNVQGALVEQRLGRSVMSRFHAGWSVGTVAGALVGTVAVALGVPVPLHLALTAAAVAVVVPLQARRFLPDRAGRAVDAPHGLAAGRDGTASAWAAWREPRTLTVGLFVLAFAFAEGVANDWVGVAVIDAYGTDAAVGTLAFAVFLAAMTTGRWFGPVLLDRFGRVPTLRVQAVVAVAGLVLFVAEPPLPVALAGVLLWGVGTSLGFPTGMSAAADDPAHAAARVGVVASIGYCAFLGGPPLIGFLGEQVTVLRALACVAVVLAVATAIAGALRPPESPGRQLPLQGGPERRDDDRAAQPLAE